MASKKKSGKSKSKSKSPKVSSKAKASIKKPKASKSFPKTNTAKSGKAKTSKKTTANAWSSVSAQKKTKTPPSPKKTKPSSSASRKKSGRSVSAGRSKGPVDAGLSTQDSYNLGGLCACVIDTTAKDGKSRLQRLLKYLNLPGIDQANLMRVSQGIRIPKLFADGLAKEGIRQKAFERLKQFAKADDPAGKQWKAHLQELDRLLGS